MWPGMSSLTAGQSSGIPDFAVVWLMTFSPHDLSSALQIVAAVVVAVPAVKAHK